MFAGGVKTTVKWTLAPAARSPIGIVRTPLTGVAPPVAETNVTPGGRVSVSTTPVAAAVPSLVTVRISVTLVPRVTDDGASPESARSGAAGGPDGADSTSS